MTALLLTTGCAFDGGEPFGVVTASLDAEYRFRDDRDVGEGYQKLSNEYQVKLDELVIEIDLIELVDTGEVAAVAFDPAAPPPGYSLCHGGHCHADDGRLVDYEDIAAELAGGGGEGSILLRLTAAPADLLAASEVALACEGSCWVEAGHVGRVRLSASSLRLGGTVRDGLDPPRIGGSLPFSATLSLLPQEGEAAPTLEAPVSLPFDDEHEPEVRLRITLHPSAALFDGIDFSAIALDASGALMIADDPELRAAILSAYSELPLGADIQRAE